MSTTVMSVKTEKKLKKEAQSIAKQLGVPLGTIMNAFLRQFVRNKTVFFTLEDREVMTKAMEKSLAKMEEDVRQDINLSPKFTDIEDAIAYLRK